MRDLKPEKVFAQYRDSMKPYGPVIGRKYTITHSDQTAELYVFIAENYAEDQVTRMHDDVKIKWQQTGRGYALLGSVLIDDKDVQGNLNLRNKIFFQEMPTVLQALRLADRFLFDEKPELDHTRVLIHFESSNPIYDKTYDFGLIENYKYSYYT